MATPGHSVPEGKSLAQDCRKPSGEGMAVQCSEVGLKSWKEMLDDSIDMPLPMPSFRKFQVPNDNLRTLIHKEWFLKNNNIVSVYVIFSTCKYHVITKK